MSSLQLQRLRRSNYTFEDFLVRLRRSRLSEIPRMYIENQLLFSQREDMLQRSVSALPWQMALRLVATAHYHQPLSTDTYRTLLGTMLTDSRTAAASGRLSCRVSWTAAMQVLSEAYVSHGRKIPSRVPQSAIRLLHPGRHWSHALRVLQFAEWNDHLTVPMALDAAGCCSTPSTWLLAISLLERVHTQHPDLLVGAITSLLPENPNAPYALLPDTKQRPRDWTRALEIIGNVVGSLPPEIALTNELSLSYISHLCNSGTYMTSERLDEALGRISWSDALGLLTRSSSILPGAAPLFPLLDGHSPRRSVEVVTRPEKAAVDDIKPSSEPDGRTSRHITARLLSCVIRRLPPDTLEAVVANFQSSGQRSFLQARDVTTAQLVVAVRGGMWEKGVELLQQLASTSHAIVDGGVLNRNEDQLVCGVVKELVSLLLEKAPQSTAAAVTPLLVNLGLTFNGKVVRRLLLSLLAGSSTRSPTDASQVQWRAALAWSVQLHEDCQAQVAEKGITTSRRVDPPLDARIGSVLVHLCVAGGSPQGALKVISHVHEHSKLRFQHANEMKALLFCMLYGRESEARAILGRSVGKDPAGSRPLVSLMKRWEWR